MATILAPPPRRRSDLLLRQLGERGDFVVKDPASGQYFRLGEQEHFLLSRMDGSTDPPSICAAFQEEFDEPLSDQDLDEFLEMARGRGFLERAAPERLNQGGAVNGAVAPVATVRRPWWKSWRQILYWRKRVLDPDVLFNWLEPRLRFFWTRSFLAFSAVGIVLAGLVAWSSCAELVSKFSQIPDWRLFVLAWLTVLAVTTCHEFAHGLTCKHHGGEVHEVGFLLLFFMPCLYCNVSDAWLLREKSKRLWVTLAGGYLDLCMWALAVFIWRLSFEDSLPNFLAWVVLSVCGARILFNFNPLVQLDGYYLLGDALEIPNLRPRALDYLAARIRWLLWGAARPERDPRGKVLLIYGVASWVFSISLISFMLLALTQYLGKRWGLVGVGLVLVLANLVRRVMFAGWSNGEVRKMIQTRRNRSLVWAAALGCGLVMLCCLNVADRASGSFQLRPAVHAEIRAPVAGFLHAIYFEEGDPVTAGARLASVDVPDLDSKLAQKRAEMREIEANLRKLEVGPRPEEVLAQRRRVERAGQWRDLAQKDLDRSQHSFKEELHRLDEQIAQFRAEVEYADYASSQAQNLVSRQYLAVTELREAKKKQQVGQAQLEQALAQRRAREALGTLETETELARREKELADAQAALVLLEAKTRPEEIDAERARLARVKEEARYYESLQSKLEVLAPVGGVITTPRLKEKASQFVKEGDLICEVEDPAVLEAEIALPEQMVVGVQPGQLVELKARAVPFHSFAATVERVGAKATAGAAESTVTIYCRLNEPAPELRRGMTGYARIYGEKRPVGVLGLERFLRLLRTEFWW